MELEKRSVLRERVSSGEGWVDYFWFVMRRLPFFQKITTSSLPLEKRRAVCWESIGLEKK